MDLARGVGLSKIGREEVSLNRQPRGELFEAIETAGGEDEVHAFRGEHLSERLANAGTGSGDDSPLAFPLRGNHLRFGDLVRFSKTNRPLLPAVAKSRSPSL